MSTSSPADESHISYLNVPQEYLYQMQMHRFEIFKAQDLENGHFDVIFEIEGKVLHANKFIVTHASETMNSWLSDRWNAKDEPIKIESYTYDIFYQFLCFIYSGSCKLNNENIFQLVDIAEFFGVLYLKLTCDEFLSNMKKMTIEKIQEMYEFAERYSLYDSMHSIDRFIRNGKSGIFKAEKFLEYEKSFVEFLSTYDRIPDYSSADFHPLKESEFFEMVYQWAEHRASKSKSVNDENFNLEKAIKAELESILPNIKFSQMNLEFLKHFVPLVKKGFILSPTELNEFFKRFRGRNHSADNEEEDLFNYVYSLAKKQALKKQAMSSDGENFNVANSIKDDLAEIIPQIKFFKMDESFLNDFVVRKGIITEEEASRVYDCRVEIKNNGNIIYGTLKRDTRLRNVLEFTSCTDQGNSDTRICFTELAVPKTPSTVTKMKGIDWYLCLEADGMLTLKHHTMVEKDDYLLVEMKSETEFKINPNEVTHLFIENDFNIFAV